MSCLLWEKKNYLLDIEYLIATKISEYDIRKANISVLYSEGAISKEYYKFLYTADRMTRQIEIGYMIRNNPEIQKILTDGIAKYRKLFFESNGIDDTDILSIKNDAVFVMKKTPSITKFGNVEFVNKNTYSSFIKINKKEVYFRSNVLTGEMNIDIKGISDLKLQYHQDYMLTVIADVMYYIETGNIKSGIDYIRDFYNAYIQRKINVGYYRNFDDESNFIIKAGVGIYSMEYCNTSMINALDISCNLRIIQELYGILTNIYFNTKRSPR